MDQSRSNKLKLAKYIKVDRNGPKWIEVDQNGRNITLMWFNNDSKFYTSAFRYYIDRFVKSIT